MVEIILNRFSSSREKFSQSQFRHLLLEVLGGFGSICFLGSSQDFKYPYKDANEALQSDWEMIGKDMTGALEQFREEQTTN